MSREHHLNRRRSLPSVPASSSTLSSPPVVVNSPRVCLDDDCWSKKLKYMCRNGYRIQVDQCRDPILLEEGQTPPLLIKEECDFDKEKVFDEVENGLTTESGTIRVSRTKRKERENDDEFCNSYSIKKCVSLRSISFRVNKAEQIGPSPAVKVDRRLSTSSSCSSLGLDDDDSLFLGLMNEAQHFNDEGFDEGYGDEDSLGSSSMSLDPFSSHDSVGNLCQKLRYGQTRSAAVGHDVNRIRSDMGVGRQTSIGV